MGYLIYISHADGEPLYEDMARTIDEAIKIVRKELKEGHGVNIIRD